MRLIFLPDGGFQNAGGFIEVENDAETSGSEEVYQRQGHLTIRLKCRDIQVRHGVHVRNEMTEEEADPSKRSSFRSIGATGDIQKSRWGQHSLSILGRKQEHRQVSISIRDHAEGEAVFAAGMSGASDVDLEYDESFFIEVVLERQRMDMILRELQMPGAELWVEAKIDKFPNFYATWSPAIDEGRTIKFLDSERDVENADEIPDDFWNRDLHREMLSGTDRQPVNVAVIRSLNPPNELEPEHDFEETPSVQAPAPDYRSLARAIADASSRITKRLMLLAVVILVSAALVALS